MTKSEKRLRHLSVYRQQLRRELDSMGYGQLQSYAPSSEAEAIGRPGPSFVALAVALAAMRLITVSG